jgi:hypothetical protein
MADDFYFNLLYFILGLASRYEIMKKVSLSNMYQCRYIVRYSNDDK